MYPKRYFGIINDLDFVLNKIIDVNAKEKKNIFLSLQLYDKKIIKKIN